MKIQIKKVQNIRSYLIVISRIILIAYLAVCVYIGVQGKIFTGIIMGVVGGPLLFVVLVLAGVLLEDRHTTKTVDDMLDTLNERVGRLSLQEALAFEAEFNRQTPDNIWHDVDVSEEEKETVVNVIHYWHNGDKREWNSELKMFFLKPSKILDRWEMLLAKGATKITKYKKSQPGEKADFFYGP